MSPKQTGFLKVHSQSLTWNLKMAPRNRRFLLETIIFRFHVKLGECISLYFLQSGHMTRNPKPEWSWPHGFFGGFPYFSPPFRVTTQRFVHYNLPNWMCRRGSRTKDGDATSRTSVFGGLTRIFDWDSKKMSYQNSQSYHYRSGINTTI